MESNLQEVIQKACQLCIQNYLEMAQFQEISFPILRTTYTLWRKVAYKHIIKSLKQYDQKKIAVEFNGISEGLLLPRFTAKLTQSIRMASEGYKRLVHMAQFKQFQNQQQYDLMLSYGELIWKQQLYVQLIEDLAKLPYAPAFAQSSHLHVKMEYLTVFSRKEQTTVEKYGQKIGKTVAMKGFSAVAEKLIKSKALMQVNTMIGGFNPLMLAMTYGFSTSLQAYTKHANHASMIEQLQNAKVQTQNKVNKLQETYFSCLELIKAILTFQSQESETLKKMGQKLKKLFFVVFEEEWLNIQIQEDGEWEIVKIEEKQNFQMLEKADELGSQS